MVARCNSESFQEDLLKWLVTKTFESHSVKEFNRIFEHLQWMSELGDSSCAISDGTVSEFKTSRALIL